MKFEFIFVGKTTDSYLAEGIKIYLRKLGHYVSSEIKIVTPSTARDKKSGLAEEAERVLKTLTPKDFFIVLDEHGKQFDSVELSKEIQKIMNRSLSRIVFLVGGAYGLQADIKKRANLIWSLSPLTFTHQMTRLILLEQVYRAMTILRGEAYHHE